MFCFQAEDGIRDLVRSRGLGDVYKRQALWREFMAGFDSKQMRGAGPLFAVDFDPAEPVTLSLIHI
mgnify:CR=1 FL=1